MLRRLGVTLFIVLAYWIGLLAIEHLPTSLGLGILFLIPIIGFFAVVWAFDPQAREET